MNNRSVWVYILSCIISSEVMAQEVDLKEIDIRQQYYIDAYNKGIELDNKGRMSIGGFYVGKRMDFLDTQLHRGSQARDPKSPSISSAIGKPIEYCQDRMFGKFLETNKRENLFQLKNYLKIHQSDFLQAMDDLNVLTQKVTNLSAKYSNATLNLQTINGVIHGYKFVWSVPKEYDLELVMSSLGALFGEPKERFGGGYMYYTLENSSKKLPKDKLSNFTNDSFQDVYLKLKLSRKEQLGIESDIDSIQDVVFISESHRVVRINAFYGYGAAKRHRYNKIEECVNKHMDGLYDYIKKQNEGKAAFSL